MRISSLQIFNIANNGMADANKAIVKTQEQLSTGRRVLNPSDDPVAATKIMQLTEELANIEQYQKNIDIATNNLVAQESILNGVNNLIQRIQELAVQAGNTATLSTNEYRALANEVDARLDELQNLLNTQNANGDYIFGGYKSGSEPFVGSASTGFRYVGDDGQQKIKVANNTEVASSDSGKSIFLDIDSGNNTVTTYASPANRSNPPVEISVGQVVDQALYDEFYPEDIIITFNANSDITPAGQNFTATERSTGRIIVENQRYSAGAAIEIQGVSVRLSGTPVSGTPATPATRLFGADSAPTFTIPIVAPATETFEITVNGRTRTLTIDSPVTNATELAAVLNDTGNGNAAILASLGLVVDTGGIRSESGANFRISGGSATLDAALGLSTSTQSNSTDGVRAVPGDQVFIDSSNKQDILTTLARFSQAMKDYDGSQDSRESLQDVVSSTLTNLGNAQTSVLEAMSVTGARFNTLESTQALHQDTELVSKELMSQLRDIDYAEAATRLSAESLVLQAAQSSFVRVSQLTLFSQL